MNQNSALLQTIEQELFSNNQETFEKVIPIKNYSYDMKKTLDYLIEKYGGFINRYDDKVIIFINHSSNKNQKSTPKIPQENRYTSLRFEKVNASINGINERLSLIEDKVSRLIEEHNKITLNQDKNLKSYLDYFETKEDKREVKRLVDEIINHK